ncbi:hypothetical protein HMPREF3144_02435 [Oligella sp. HMSC05A10]|uniref:siderophore-interacting protein n=1 Tax=Oligella TaxID=90243 RepID=UPI0008A5ED94|nr:MULTISPECIES: siderophore-interacting protein [Oligella]AVL70309.1 siderophore-interacting protein [Oligella urethralis]OFS88333.1 hypothetical protein HMPREF3144_02435 [Oligella sp. HMSC05A10]PMC15368.1 siderophore-interacting protein [Oligella urethralis]
MQKNHGYTAFQSEQKDHWIESLNGGGNHEFLSFVKVNTPFRHAQIAFIEDIFYEGFLINVANNLEDTPHLFFYAFPDKNKHPMDSFSELYIRFLAESENVVNINQHRLFIVLKKSFISPSFVRLQLQYDTLATNIKPAFITTLAIGETLLRAYTYRRINKEVKYIEIDFFIHGNTPTFQWLTQLKPGQHVITQRERNESINHLMTGKAVLCGDETAFPAIAAILENWRNPEPPIVLLEMLNIADSCYFDDCLIPEGTKMHFFSVMTLHHYGQEVKKFIEKEQLMIDKVWGAFNTFGMKLLRQFFEKNYQLTVDDMVLRVYWNPNKKT